jgi:hypothetical protein
MFVLPWVFMWTVIAGTCAPMMNGMPQMMEMMR